MSTFKQVGQLMMAGARAHAKWEKEMSDRILGDRKRLIILGLLVLPILLGGMVYADELTTSLPGILGGKMAYSPAFYTPTIFFASIGIGVGAGLITGCIGAGGGFIIAPALMSAGVKGIMRWVRICSIFVPRRSWVASSIANWAIFPCPWPWSF